MLPDQEHQIDTTSARQVISTFSALENGSLMTATSCFLTKTRQYQLPALIADADNMLDQAADWQEIGQKIIHR